MAVILRKNRSPEVAPVAPPPTPATVRFLQLWRDRTAFSVRSAPRAEFARLQDEAWAIQVPDGFENIDLIISEPPYIEVGSLVGIYERPTQFERRVLGGCPFISAIVSMLEQTKSAPGLQLQKLSIVDIVDCTTNPIPITYEQDRPYPRNFTTPQDVHEFWRVYRPTFRARRKFFQLLHDRLVAQRRQAIEDLYRSEQIVADVCDDETGDLKKFPLGFWRLKDTKLDGDFIVMRDSTGRVRRFQVVNVECRETAAAGKPGARENAMEFGTAKELIRTYFEQVRPQTDGKKTGRIVAELRQHPAFAKQAAKYGNDALAKEIRALIVIRKDRAKRAAGGNVIGVGRLNG